MIKDFHRQRLPKNLRNRSGHKNARGLWSRAEFFASPDVRPVLCASAALMIQASAARRACCGARKPASDFGRVRSAGPEVSDNGPHSQPAAG